VTRPPVQVIQIGRDEHGITYSGAVEPPTPQTEPPASKPIRVRSKRAAEKLGWRITGEPEHLREVPGTPYMEKVPGSYQGEWVGRRLPSDFPQAHHQYGASLEALLKNIEAWETRRNQ
jgi:hypothetical protein